MKTDTLKENQVQEKVTLTLPREIVEDLRQAASFNKTGLEDLIYSYIVDGIAGDALAIKRMKFTENANETFQKSNVPLKTVEDIFNNLVY